MVGCSDSTRPAKVPGTVDGFNLSTEVQVRFGETDAQGVVHNAVYLDWSEVARITYLARFRGGYRACATR